MQKQLMSQTREFMSSQGSQQKHLKTSRFSALIRDHTECLIRTLCISHTAQCIIFTLRNCYELHICLRIFKQFQISYIIKTNKDRGHICLSFPSSLSKDQQSVFHDLYSDISLTANDLISQLITITKSDPSMCFSTLSEMVF